MKELLRDQLHRMRASSDTTNGISEPAHVPQVTWDDVGGLQDVIDSLKHLISLVVANPEDEEKSRRRHGLQHLGVLLYGPPGTGKTLLAKAVATECQLNFIGVKGPELINMYVGQSEENVRQLFQQARRNAPCVLFCDEFDALAPARGRSGDSGGVMDRVVSQLATELDSLHDEEFPSGGVILLGATNLPSSIDRALLRSGRIDRVFYVGGTGAGLSADDSASEVQKLQLMRSVTRRLRLDDDVDLGRIVAALPRRVTGADMYALACEATMNSLRRVVRLVEDGEKRETEANLLISQEDFTLALETWRPSVTEQDFDMFDAVMSTYEHS